MTPDELHDYFAGQAIAGLADKNLSDHDVNLIAANAYKLADQMIAEKRSREAKKDQPTFEAPQSFGRSTNGRARRSDPETLGGGRRNDGRSLQPAWLRRDRGGA